MWILGSMHEKISFNVYRHFENILDVLSKYYAPATFFITGTMAEIHPLIAKRMYKNDHEKVSHGYSYKSLFKASARAIKKSRHT